VFFFFFFQAEDGIRDLIVTGVQTCALPIFVEPRQHRPWQSTRDASFVRPPVLGLVGGADLARCRLPIGDYLGLRGERRQMPVGRSEERRVGKECRSWWARYRYRR